METGDLLFPGVIIIVTSFIYMFRHQIQNKVTTFLNQKNNKNCPNLPANALDSFEEINATKTVANNNSNIFLQTEKTENVNVNNLIQNTVVNAEPKKKKKIFPITYNVPRKVKLFCGREDEMKTIQKELVHHEDKTVIISGMPGQGKTSLATTFVLKYKEEFDGNLVWIPSEHKTAIEDTVTKLVKLLDLNKGSDMNQVYSYLEDKKFLVVFDNAQNWQDIHSFLPNEEIHKDINYHIIITSLRQDWNIGYHLKLSSLPPEVCLTLMEKNITTEIFQKYAKSSWNKLMMILGSNALAVQIVASLIRQEVAIYKDRFNLENYITDMESSESFLLENVPKNELTSYEKSVFLAICQSINAIEKENGTALSLLYFLTYLNPDKISEKLLEFLVKSRDKNTNLSQYLKYILPYSLITRFEDNNATLVSVHRLVQKTIYYHQKSNNKNKEYFRYLLQKLFDNNTPYKDELSYILFDINKCLEIYEECDYQFLENLVRYGYNKTLKNLLEEDRKIHKDNNLISTLNLLHKAVKFEQESVVCTLLELGANVDEKDSNNKCVLELLVPKMEVHNEKVVEILKHLLNYNVNINISLGNNTSFLQKVIRTNNIHYISCLNRECFQRCEINSFAEEIFTSEFFNLNQYNIQLLIDIIDVLLRCGFDINYLDFNGNSLLHVAVKYRNPELVEYITSQKDFKHINTCNHFGVCSLEKFILNVNQDNSDNIRILEILLENNVNVDVIFSTKKSFLYELVMTCAPKLITSFFDQQNNSSDTFKNIFRTRQSIEAFVLCYSSLSNFFEVLKILLRNGINIDVHVVLRIALEIRKFDVVIRLIEDQKYYGLNVNKIDSFSLQSYLHSAINVLKSSLSISQGTELKIVDLLIKKGIDVNLVDVEGNTALHLIAQFTEVIEHVEKIDNVISLLIQNGIETNIKNKNGLTAYNVATRNMKSILRRHRAKPKWNIKMLFK